MAKAQSNRTRKERDDTSSFPVGFWSILGLILKNTLVMFFKKLPSTLFFIFLALILHTFLLVVVNDGFSKNSFVADFLSISTQPFSSIVIWTVVPMLVATFFSRKKEGKQTLRLGDRLAAVSNYFVHAKKDALAVTLGSFGVALTIGTFMNGYASIVMAAGVGAFLASKSGSVMALLFRSAWNSIFSVARRENIVRYGLAAGYVTLFTSSLGFIVNSALAPNGLAFGIVFLVLAIIIAKGIGTPPAATPLIILGVIVVGNLFFGFDLLWAHDGGWSEGGRSLESWWRSSGSTQAILMGVGPAIGAGFGLLIQRVLSEMADSIPHKIEFPDDKTIPSNQDESEENADKTSVDDQLEDPDTHKKLPINDGGYETGKKGQVWWNGKWVDRSEALRHIAERKREIKQINRENEKRLDDWRRRNKELDRERYDKMRSEEQERKRQKIEDQHRRDLYNQIGKKHDDDVSIDDYRKIIELKSKKDWDGLKKIYEGYIKGEIDESQKEHDHQIVISDRYKAAEIVAKGVVIASKAGLMVVGGPAGAVATGIGVGAISAAGEGAESQAKGEGYAKVILHTAGGFMSGFKDGAIGHYTNMPGVSTPVKIFLPAAADAGEIFIRTGGDVKETVKAAIFSGASGALGHAASGIKGVVAREGSEAIIATGMSGLQSVAHGGSFKEGAKEGFFSHLAGKAGGAAGGHAAKYTTPKSSIPEQTIKNTDSADQAVKRPIRNNDSADQPAKRATKDTDSTDQAKQSREDTDSAEESVKKALEENKEESEQIKNNDSADQPAKRVTKDTDSTDQAKQSRKDTDSAEESVKKALKENKEESKKIIELDKQPDVIKDLNDSKQTVIDSEGNTKTYVDPVKALDQLSDTKVSRSAKRAPEDVKQPIIDTRKDKIYKPADDATIKATLESSDPETQKWLQKNMKKGDKLVMDTFSTPGSKPGLGADRDARLVIERKIFDSETGKPVIDPDTGKQKIEKIEVPRKYWEDQAYKDFYEHAKNLNTESGQNFEQKLQNDEGYQERYKKLEYLKGSGMTEEQIKHRAYAESRNQLFTDKGHMEASRANSDQAIKGGKPVQVNDSNVIDAKEGKAPLEDPEGFGRMWDEKSHFYHDHPAEALAQSKKGIEQMMGVRDGQRKAGLDPAPLKPEFAEAMKIIVKAPTDASATPEAIAQLNKQIQAIKDSSGRPVFKDANDAMSKIGRSVEFNKWTARAKQPEAPDTDTSSAPSVKPDPSLSDNLSKSQATRLTLTEQQREMLDKIDNNTNGGNQ